MLKSYRLFKDKFVAAMDEISTPQMVLQLSLKWPNGSTQETMMQVLRKLLRLCWKSLGLVFVEEVLDADIEALIQNVKKRVLIVTLRQRTKSVIN